MRAFFFYGDVVAVPGVATVIEAHLLPSHVLEKCLAASARRTMFKGTVLRRIYPLPEEIFTFTCFGMAETLRNRRRCADGIVKRVRILAFADFDCYRCRASNSLRERTRRDWCTRDEVVVHPQAPQFPESLTKDRNLFTGAFPL
jgi:hypothetical protein